MTASESFAHVRGWRSLKSRRRDFMADSTTGDTNDSTRAEIARRGSQGDLVEISTVAVGSREAFLFPPCGGTRAHALSTIVPSLPRVSWGAMGYPLTNLSPREVELIRIGMMLDTYFNARAYINLFKMYMGEGGTEAEG